MARDAQRDLQVVDHLQDPFIRRSLKAALHLRRYFPLYVFALIWVLLLGLFPTIQDRGGDGGTDLATGQGDRFGEESEMDGGQLEAGEGAGGEAGGGAAGGGGGGARGPQVSPQSARESLETAQRATGKTKGGIDCAPGVRQFPSAYAAQCTAAFTGNNGGATAPGVSGDKIRIVRRGFPDSANSRAVSAVVQQAGGAPPELVNQLRDVFITYFEKMYELYGRRIEWVDYDSRYGNSTDEALGKGREGACADATFIKKEMNAFAVWPGRNTAGTLSAVFAECAAARGMITFGAAAYYPESWYRQHHPWVWGGVMECERIAHQVSEYAAKRLINKKARWAKDPLLKNSNRKFGTYVPDLDGYQRCVKITEDNLRQKYGYQDKTEQYNYALDVSRFPDQAAQAMVQFKAANVTTVVMACDPISVIFMTQAASRQNYHPEWFVIGTALNDVDNAARLFDQDQVEGSLFGMSQLGSTLKLVGPDSEPARIYEQETGKKWPGAQQVTDGGYWGLVGLYNGLQAAGPLLTPDTHAEGRFRLLPGGAPDFPVGYISHRDGPDGTPGARDHTGIDDAREIFWMRNAKSPSDGKTGTYFETYGGKRFRNGEWPAEDPPIYPGG